MKRTWSLAVAVPLVIVACQGTAVQSGAVRTPGALGEAPHLATEPEVNGEALYKKLCATCHGDDGKGDGRAAEFLSPKPRNFTTGQFKVRATPSGAAPTDEDILRTINNGMPGSAMPGFSYLTEGNRRRLAAHVKQLARIQANPDRIISAPAAPAVTPAMLGQGKKLYGLMQCGKCHGDAGRGDGPAAATLLDDAGQPILPADFTRGIYKGGGTVSDVYLRFSTGMNGTPMPSYEDSLGEADRFALAHYVKSLAGPKVAVQPSTGVIEAGRTSGPPPKDAQNPLWDAAVPATVPLMLLWQRNTPVADSVSVRALHDGQSIALLIEWDDPDVSSRFRRDGDFHDAAAVMFSLSPELPITEQPHFAMGEEKKPVNIWYWSLDRRVPVAEVKPTIVAMSGPASFGTTRMTVARSTPSGVVEDMNAEQFRTVSPQPPEDQNVGGQGVYAEGRWKVVFTRKIESNAQLDARLDAGAVVPVGFAVWNGSQEERNGKKAISTWYSLRLAE